MSMASEWGGDSVNMDSEVGQWNPSAAYPDGKPHSFAMTRTSFSSAASSWADCGHSTSTSSSSSKWPISSVGNWSNTEMGEWTNPQAVNTGAKQWSNTPTGQLPNTGVGEWANTSSLSRDAPEDGVEWPSGPPVNRWQDTDANTTAEVQDDEEDMMEDDNHKEPCTGVIYASPISRNEYDKQCKDYTKQAVAQLIASPEYQKKHTTCELCWCVWAQGQTQDSCPECGGFTMERSCPVCDGRCDAVWKRDVDLSHSQHQAHWEGECKLPWKQRQGFLAQKLLDSDEPVTDEQLAEDFSELKSS